MKKSRTKLLMHHTKSLPMICFCDMPLSNISDHVEVYGHYAIGFNKKELNKAVLQNTQSRELYYFGTTIQNC